MAGPDKQARTAQTVPGRNPRRRQRNDSTEALTLQAQPKRKRSKVSEDLSENRLELLRARSETVDDHDAIIIDADIPRHSVEIPTRTKPLKRGSRHEDHWMLARTPNYNAKLSPSLPQQLRNVAFRGSLVPTIRLALALTQTHAFIWDRSSTASSPSPRTFDLPFSNSKIQDPLPFGSLVSAGSVHETGLVVVSATTGKIMFWENVENADALSLFEKRRNGIEGSIGSLFSGETVTRMESADHAGFILVLSSGRVAQLSLRDAQSKPAISVKFLRGGPPPARGGLLGGLTNALTGGNWMRNVVAARSRISSTRGHVDLILANEDARFQTWQLGWSGHSEFVQEIDAHRSVSEQIRRELDLNAQDSFNMKVVDFASTNDTVSKERADELGVITLMAISGTSSLQFALADLLLTNESVKVRRIIRIATYAPSHLLDKQSKPRLVVSESGQTAFAVFEKAAIIISLATVDASPDMQLALEAEAVPRPFEETLFLRDDELICFAGVESEKSGDTAHSGIVNLFIQSRGIVRLTVPEPETGSLLAVQRHPISAQSRIEQAVFYGTKPNNPFNLARSSRLETNLAEVEAAALTVSKNILTSVGQSTADSDIDIAGHLAERAIRLKSLALHLKHNYAALSRKTRWLLSFDAEMLASAQEVWRLYQQQQSDGVTEGKLLTELINMIDDKYNSELDPSKGETDEVRHWFIKHINHMDQLIMWVYQSFYEMVANEFENPSAELLAPLVLQANEMVIGALEAAFMFRAANAWDYNIEDEVLPDGLPKEAYEGLPEFWTSRFSIMDKIQELVDNSRDLVLECSDPKHPVTDIVAQIASFNPKLIDVVCRSWEERCKWHWSTDEQNTREVAPHVEKMYTTKRTEMIVRLHDIDMTDEGFQLGEKYGDMSALVHLFRLEVQDVQVLLDPSGSLESQEEGRLLFTKLSASERRWFSQFGREWADTFYTSLINNEQYGQLLNQARNTRTDLTRFLRQEESRKGICWINDVLSERDYAHSAKTLLQVAGAGRQSNWCQRVELSLAKLSLLASIEATEATEDAQLEQAIEDAVLSRCNREISVAKVRQRVYDMLHDTAVHALDSQAEIVLIMEAYGSSRTGSALGELFGRAVETLMQGPGPDIEQLLDLLTLIDRKPAAQSGSPEISAEVYVLALEALRSCESDVEPARFKLMSATTWRRILIQDEWHKINNTEHKSDGLIVETLLGTCLFQVLYLSMKTAWGKGGETSLIPGLGEITGIGSTPEGLEPRFADETIRRHVAKEVETEDEMLKDYIEHDRLEHWVETTKKLAEEQVHREVAEKQVTEQAIRNASIKERAESTASRGRR